MNERDAPQSASAEEEARIGETPAVFANKVYVSPMRAVRKSHLPKRNGYPAGTGHRQGWRYSCRTPISPPCAACSTGRQAPPIRRRKASAARCTEPRGGHIP